MRDLFIFDDSDNLLCLLSNEGKESCIFWEAIYEADLKGTRLFEFKTLADHEFSQHIKELNYVGFYDRENKFRLFKIESVVYESDSDGDYIQVYTQASMLELLNKIVEERRPQDRNIEYMLGIALEGTRYQVGNCAPLGDKSTSFFFLNGIEVINKIANLFGAEVEERIETDGQRITGRYIDMPARLGVDTGKVLELTQDVMSMSKTVSTAHMATALYGRGSSLEQEREDEETGETITSHSRKIDFAEVEWKKGVNGAPLNKPRGQKYIEDPEATELFGLVQDGKRIALYNVYENSNQENPEQLLWDTYGELQRRTQRFYNFEMSIVLLGDLIGYEAHKLNLGDTVRVVNNRFKNPIATEARIIRTIYDVADDNHIADVELGHFINLYSESDRIDDLKDQIDIISSRPIEIIDGNIKNIPPARVTNLEAYGGFDHIHLFWDNQGVTVKDFELHASEVQGFVPSSSNMIYRGRANAFGHKTKANQQWYFRCRAVNYHGVVGEWSVEASAQTANTKDLDELESHIDDLNDNILPDLDDRIENNKERLDELNNVTLPELENELSDAQENINNALDNIRDVEEIMDNWKYEDTVEIDGGAIRADTITARQVRAGTITAVEIQAGSITGDRLEVNTITAQQIKADAITTNHIQADAITANKIAADTITAEHIQADAITANKIAADTITANHIQADAITTNKIASNAILARHITTGSITADSIVTGAIRAVHIQAGTITGDHINGRLLQGITLQSSSGNNLVRITNGRVDVHFQGQVNNIGMRLDQGTLRIMNSGIPPASAVTPPNGELAGFTRLHNAAFNSIIGSAIVTRGNNNGMVFRLASQGNQGWGYSRSHIQTTNNSAGTTQIWGASAMSAISMNNHPLEGMTAFGGDGDVDVRKEKALRVRKLGTTNFTENSEMSLVSYMVDGEKGTLICNQYPEPSGGFWIGENGSIGIMVEGVVKKIKGVEIDE